MREETWRQLLAVADEEVESLRQSFPPEIQRALTDVPVLLQRKPDYELFGKSVDPDALGLFDGYAMDEAQGVDVTPPTIYLFLENIWEEARHSPDRFRKEAGITFLHEVGHYLGWDEDEVSERGLE